MKIDKKIKYFLIILIIFSLYQFCIKIFIESHQEKVSIISKQSEINLLKQKVYGRKN